MNVDHELERIVAIARQGLERDFEDPEDELRLTTFAVVCIFNHDDEDDNIETTSVYSETSSQFGKLGILHQGLKRLDYDVEYD